MFGRSAAVSIVCAILVLGAAAGCSIVRSVSGTELDAEKFARAREAKTLEIRLRESVALAERLQRSNPYSEGDATLQLSERMLNKTAQWYKGRSGWLDPKTRYTVDSIHIALHQGSAIGTISLHAEQKSWDVALRLDMDCLIRFGKTETDLEMWFEPYNISPVIESTGFLIGSGSMIANIVKGKLGRLSEDFPPLRLPVNFDTSIPIDNQLVRIREGINMDMSLPHRVLDFRLSIRDVFVVREGVFVLLDQTRIAVR